MTASPTTTKGTPMTVSLTKTDTSPQGMLREMGASPAAINRYPEVRAYFASNPRYSDRFNTTLQLNSCGCNRASCRRMPLIRRTHERRPIMTLAEGGLGT